MNKTCILLAALATAATASAVWYFAQPRDRAVTLDVRPNELPERPAVRHRDPEALKLPTAAEGDYANGCAFGFNARASARGEFSRCAVVGESCSSDVTGDSSKTAAAGERSAATAHGEHATAATAGDASSARATGDGSSVAASGRSAAAIVRGDQSNSAASGDGAAATSVGDASSAATTGTASAAACDTNGFACCAGIGGRVRGNAGSALALGWRDKSGHARITVACVGDPGIKPATWYQLDDNGKFVEALNIPASH